MQLGRVQLHALGQATATHIWPVNPDMSQHQWTMANSRRVTNAGRLALLAPMPAAAMLYTQLATSCMSIRKREINWYVRLD